MCDPQTPLTGKYRATVIDNNDPQGRGRLKVKVTDVSGNETTTLALPCLPITGSSSGMFTIPVVGSHVWVEYENGHHDHPIWVGGFYGDGSHVPAMAQQITSNVPGFCYQTPKGNGLIISDEAGENGGIILKSASGVSIIINDTGITIKTGKGATIVLKGSEVNVNDGAMTIT